MLVAMHRLRMDALQKVNALLYETAQIFCTICARAKKNVFMLSLSLSLSHVTVLHYVMSLHLILEVILITITVDHIV